MSALGGWTLEELRRSLASPSAETGGGTAVLVGAAFGACLLSMAVGLTCRHTPCGELEALGRRAEETSRTLLEVAQADGQSYSRVLEAQRLPRQTPEQEALRREKVNLALQEAIELPLTAAGLCLEMMEMATSLLDRCRPATRSDLASGVFLLVAGLKGSLLNVHQNCAYHPDAGTWLERARYLQAAGDRQASEFLTRLEELG
ncbi:MAG: cyclodeaminase/cyclohydrolase family protein [Candidatus Xenobium sp.]|nr:cyclodeaminase/cyclohydrolase family protein [Burkholderiales bacterium]